MLQDAGFEPNVVPDKLLLPIFEGMSMEDDEDLHTMWAALLANAATPEGSESVRPGFAAILREMAPDEAKVLKWTHDHSQGWDQHLRGLKRIEAQVALKFTSRERKLRGAVTFVPVWPFA
jgi:Abortive infection alpha